MKKLIYIWVLLIFPLLNSCIPDWLLPSKKEKKATFSDTPVNLENINSAYDDYNSNLNIEQNTWNLCFSSKRNSAGQNFDFVYKLLDTDIFYYDGVYHVQGKRYCLLIL